MFAALITCCLLTVGVPTAVLAFYNSVTTEANINIKLQAGQTSVRLPTQFDRDPPSVVSLEGYDIPEGSLVALSADSAGLLTLSDGSEAPPKPLVSIQLYSNTQLRVERARLPRFRGSAREDEFILQLSSGRAQMTIGDTGRRFRLRVRTPHASIAIETPGIYTVEQSGEATRVNVVNGSAIVATANGETALNLYQGQRTVVTESSIAGALPPLHNLIKNGQFAAGLSPAWKVETQVAQTGAISGTASVISHDGKSALLLERVGDGIGWGRTGVSQALDVRVDESRDLRLVLDFAILYQELPVCAGVGSECPLFVAITWRDTKDGVREWIQGFYAEGTPQIAPGQPALPDSILTNPQRKHVKVPLGQRVRWETGNLLPFLPNVQTIESIRIYAEGHAVRTQINEVALLLQD